LNEIEKSPNKDVSDRLLRLPFFNAMTQTEQAWVIGPSRNSSNEMVERLSCVVEPSSCKR
jgi:hypothetical protein